METNRNQLGSEKINVLLRRFATPSIIAMMVGALYNIIDQFFIGNYIGMYGNAATNVALPFTTICMSWALMSGLGGAAGFNLNLGAGKADVAARYMGTSICMLLGGGIALSVIAVLFLEPLLLFCGSTPEVMPYALSFTSISTLGFPFLVFSTGACHLIRADGSPRYAMFTALSGAELFFKPAVYFRVQHGYSWFGDGYGNGTGSFFIDCHLVFVQTPAVSYTVQRLLHGYDWQDAACYGAGVI